MLTNANSQEGNHMKKTLSLLLILTMIIGVLSLVSCGEPKAPAGTITRMTIELNPKIEIMLNENGTVISAVPLNDDAALLLAGEELVGKTAEEAIDLTLTVAKETGYLISGNVTADQNNLKISVSGSGAYADHLAKKANEKAVSVLKALDVKGKVERIDALGTEALRQLASVSTLYTEDELAKMDGDALCKAIAEGRIETALVFTSEMREAYLSAKQHEISIAKSEAVAKIIEELGGAYLVTHAAYKAAVDAYASAINSLEELRYETLISPDSAYQKSLVALRESKTELIKQRTITASFKIDSEEYANASVTLGLTEEAYNNALAAYEELGRAASAAIDALVAPISAAEKRLRELENTIFNDTIEKTLEERAYDIEAALFEAKAEFFAKFEESHGEDLKAIEKALIDKKAELKAEIAEKIK